MNQANLNLNLFSGLMLLLLSFLWGGSFFFIGVAVREVSPVLIVFLRVCVATIVLWLVIILLRKKVPKQFKIWRMFLLLGLLNNLIPFLLIVWGQTQITSGLAAILNATTPIFSVLVTGFFSADERFTPLKVAGALTGFIGVSVMIGLSFLTVKTDYLPQLAILGAALSYALAALYGRQFKAFDVSPLMLATGQLTASSFLLFPLVYFTGEFVFLSDISSQALGAILALAIISTAFAYILYFKILKQAGATNVLLVTLLAPITAVFLGGLFLNETLHWQQLFGICVIALGLSMIDGRLWRCCDKNFP